MLSAGSIVGNYEVVAPIAAGGMGIVYHGRNRALHTDVAIKVLLPTLASREGIRARFKQEAYVQSQLVHPHIVRVFDFVESDTVAAAVMDLITGVSLEDALCAHPGAWDWARVETIIWPILSAVGYAHSRAVVHRDLKPANILLDRAADPEGIGVPQVCDFGLAKILAGSEGLTLTGARMGTFPYMAPEQYRGEKTIGPATDVFALGMILWRLLVGRLPVDPESPRDVHLMYEGTAPIPSLRDLRPDLPTHIAAAVAAALSVDQIARPDNIETLADSLRAEACARSSVRSTRPAENAGYSPRVVPPAPPTRMEPVEGREASPAAEMADTAASQNQHHEPNAPKETGAPDGPASHPPRWRVLAIVAVLTWAIAAIGAAWWWFGIEEPHRDREACEWARERDLASGWERYLDAYPKGECTQHAKARIAFREEARTEAETKGRAKAEAKARAEAETKGRTEVEAKAQAEAEAKGRTEAEARARAEATGRADSPEWIRIEGGVFEMGSNNGDSDERPVHRVRVPTFELARTEVTVKQYAACVSAGACTVPRATSGSCTWGTMGKENHPINCVEWYQARAFAMWAGGRLPSEAEWEYAARSGGRRVMYPWGDEQATCDRAVMGNGFGSACGKGHSPWAVCSKPAGNSAQGLCDLAGNVREWVEDCLHGYEGAPSDGSAWTTNCASSERLARGGSWKYNAVVCRAANRYTYAPGKHSPNLGFRPARSVNSISLSSAEHEKPSMP